MAVAEWWHIQPQLVFVESLGSQLPSQEALGEGGVLLRVDVKVIDIDRAGRIKLSRKALLDN